MLLLSDFENRHNIQKGTPTYENLTPSEKIICGRYMRVEARGKLHMKPASMLFNLNQLRQVNLLLKYRREAGVPESNPYLFASNNTFLRLVQYSEVWLMNPKPNAQISY